MDWILSVSMEEQSLGRLSAETAQAANAALTVHGCVQLSGVFQQSTIDTLFKDYLARYGALSAREMHERATRDKPKAISVRGDARYEITPRMTGAFGEPDVFANRLLVEFLSPLLDRDVHLSSFTIVVSHPGAVLQAIHRDYGHLFSEPTVSLNLPPYAINVVVPLIDVDIATGPTGVWPGSHKWPTDRRPEIGDMRVSPIRRGDCLLIDYRTLHTGLPNRSTCVRPIMCMVYARQWFFDDTTYFAAKSVDISIQDYTRWPKHVQVLLARGVSQSMRGQWCDMEPAGVVPAEG